MYPNYRLIHPTREALGDASVIDQETRESSFLWIQAVSQGLISRDFQL